MLFDNVMLRVAGAMTESDLTEKGCQTCYGLSSVSVEAGVSNAMLYRDESQCLWSTGRAGASAQSEPAGVLAQARPSSVRSLSRGPPARSLRQGRHARSVLTHRCARSVRAPRSARVRRRAHSGRRPRSVRARRLAQSEPARAQRQGLVTTEMAAKWRGAPAKPAAAAHQPQAHKGGRHADRGGREARLARRRRGG
jgi:hypothetical protein